LIIQRLIQLLRLCNNNVGELIVHHLSSALRRQLGLQSKMLSPAIRLRSLNDSMFKLRGCFVMLIQVIDDKLEAFSKLLRMQNIGTPVERMQNAIG